MDPSPALESFLVPRDALDRRFSPLVMERTDRTFVSLGNSCSANTGVQNDHFAGIALVNSILLRLCSLCSASIWKIYTLHRTRSAITWLEPRADEFNVPPDPVLSARWQATETSRSRIFASSAEDPELASSISDDVLHGIVRNDC